MKTIKIKRSKWLRGDNKPPVRSILCDPFTEHKCCLGFALNQIYKIPTKLMMGMACPMDVCKTENSFVRKAKNSNLLLSPTGYVDTELSCQAMEINDDHIITDEEREQKLTTLFKKHGFKLIFVD